MKRFLLPWAIFLLAVAPLLARADGREVVVVYNKNMPESGAVAEYYARLRNVPDRQIFGFALTTNEIISRQEFRNSLQLPLARDIEAAGLWKMARTIVPATNGEPKRAFRRVVASRIRYAVLCYGVPLKIASDPDLHEPTPANLPPELRRDDASVDSELAWLPLLEANPRLTGPMVNWTYGVTNTALLNPTNGILLVARLDGPSADIARGLVDKALQAERDGLWGRGYFDARGLARTNTLYLGDEWILTAAEIWRGLGFDAFVDDRPDTFPSDFPMSQIAIYCGWYASDVCGPLAQPEVEFMPGAFAYHLHSYSAANLRSTNQNWCGPLLAKGATCTMGCVDEPGLGFTPNVLAFLWRWSLDHFTYGEAAWAAQPAVSWQTTVIGDPLYCPFGKEPEKLHSQLQRAGNPLIEWSYLRLVNLAQVRGVPPFELEDYIENLSIADSSAVLTEKLADLCDTDGKPDSAAQFYQRALNLNPSPEQRIRIRLALAGELLTQGQTAGAIQDYKELLEESPAWPGKASISDKIAALEQKISAAK